MPNYSRQADHTGYCLIKSGPYERHPTLKPSKNVPDKHVITPNHANNLKAWILAVVVGVSSTVFQVLGLEVPLRYGRAEILESGEWWRVLTGNLVHLGYPHLLLNLAGLAMITILLAHALTVRQWALTGLISMLGVGIGLLLFDPHLSWYVGLSGALYGLLLGGAIAEFRNHKFIACLIGAYTIGKVVWEQIYGAVESSETITGGNVIVNAHLYGMIAGGVAVLILLTVEYKLTKRSAAQ